MELEFEWRPGWATHVLGRYERREFDPVTQTATPQHVTMDCEQCKAHYQTTCTTGAVRTHIARFAALHLHKDVFGE